MTSPTEPARPNELNDRAPWIPEQTLANHLVPDPPNDWHEIDNLTADEAREVAKLAITRLRSESSDAEKLREALRRIGFHNHATHGMWARVAPSWRDCNALALSEFVPSPETP